MSKSKRTRKIVLACKFNPTELGIEPTEHIKKMKNPQKTAILDYYKNQIDPLIKVTQKLSQLVGEPTNQPDREKQIEAFNSQVFIARNSVIQYFVVLDNAIGYLLTQYQSNLQIPSDQIENFTEIDIGIGKFLPKEKITPEFDKIYSRLKHFRTLRNQFAHYPNGIFCLEAKLESFESFLKTLDGFTLDNEGGYHCYINGKAGIVIPYSSNSSEYIFNLMQTGTSFYKFILEMLFSNENK